MNVFNFGSINIKNADFLRGKCTFVLCACNADPLLAYLQDFCESTGQVVCIPVVLYELKNQGIYLPFLPPG